MDRREGVDWLWRAAQQGYREAKADLRALADAGVIQAAAPLYLPFISPVFHISPLYFPLHLPYSISALYLLLLRVSPLYLPFSLTPIL